MVKNSTESLYQVQTTYQNAHVSPKYSDKLIAASELYTAIGKWVMTYGPPLELSPGNLEIKVYEFSRFDARMGDITLLVKLWRATSQVAPKEEIKEAVTKPAHPKAIQNLIEGQAISEVTDWQSRWNDKYYGY